MKLRCGSAHVRTFELQRRNPEPQPDNLDPSPDARPQLSRQMKVLQGGFVITSGVGER